MSSPLLDALAPRTAWRATSWYLVLTLAMTWPLAAGLSRDIPWDLGDSLLNCWILSWNSEHLLKALHGDWRALSGFFDANIFYPQRLTLAYSELLIAQTLQGLPVYALTGNAILTYNVVFLATFVLCGLGAFLLVRELTGDWRAGFAAGLVYAFLPWRTGQMPHVQMLSSQWMPFTLYGLSRYFASGRSRALAGAAAALVANNLSNGYFLLFFAPFVPAYALWEMARRGRLADRRAWGGLVMTAAVVAACTVPFLLPYVWLRQATGEHRGLGEVTWFSADVYAYLTAEYNLTLLGPWLRTFPRGEGDLFPGFTPVLLAAIALVGGAARALRATASAGPVVPGSATWVGLLRRLAVIAGFAVGAIYLVVLLVVVAGHGGKFTVFAFDLRVSSVTNATRMLALSLALLAAGSSRARAVLVRAWRSPLAWFAAMAVLAWLLSLGPHPQSRGRELNAPGLYALLYEHVPGFDGLRVPARFSVLVVLGLSVLSGFGIRDLLRRRPTAAPAVLALGVVFLAESTAAPIPVNVSSSDKYVAPPARVYPPWQAPSVYQHLATLPRSAVIVELPFGDAGWELRYVYYSTVHWLPLVNGYSGGFPESYLRLRGHLDDPRRAPADALSALAASGATHVVLHTAAYRGDEAREIRAWLEAGGLRLAGSFGPDLVYRLE